MRVLIVSSEAAPFAKTGGLADVTSALARTLARRGHDVRLFLPMYRRVRAAGWPFEPVPELQDVDLRMGDRALPFSVSCTPLPGAQTSVWLVRCPQLYDRDSIYTQDPDESLRFGLLQRAALSACQHTGWSPDIVHCNDWHTGLIPLYLKLLAWDELFRGTRTVLTIHNLAYQGIFSEDVLGALDLDGERAALYQEDLAEGRLSFLKTGILYADALTTVSRTYAREIQTPEFGMGLDELLRQRSDSLFGIVNGVDYDEWDPARDRRIPARYSAADLSGKRACKQALMRRLELPFDARVPAFGIISRLTYQKGFELLPDILPVFLQREDMRLVVLGSGEEKYVRYFDWLAQTFSDKVAFRSEYDEDLAHGIEAGCDMFLMPSRFEPCGLNQMYSLRYGTPPIVRATGGLADTVRDADLQEGTGDGFVFHDFTPEALYGAIERALSAWRDEDAWLALVRRAMAADWSWERQILPYEELYRRLLGRA